MSVECSCPKADIDQVTRVFTGQINTVCEQLAGSRHDFGKGLWRRKVNRAIYVSGEVKSLGGNEDSYSELYLNYRRAKDGKRIIDRAALELNPYSERLSASLKAGWYDGRIVGMKLAWGLKDQQAIIRLVGSQSRFKWLLDRSYTSSIPRRNCSPLSTEGFGQVLNLVFQAADGGCPAIILSQEVAGRYADGDCGGITLATVFRYSPKNDVFVQNRSALRGYVFGGPDVDLSQFRPAFPQAIDRQTFLDLAQEIASIIPFPPISQAA